MRDLRVQVPPTLWKQVADTLRTAIAYGDLEPGERLVERVLCERIGVSRTSLREALRELENEGLVTSIPNRGLIISPLEPKTAKNIFDLRAALEALICKLFCSSASDDHIRRLKDAFKAVTRAYETGDGRRAIEAKTVFYDVIMEGCDNPEAVRMLRSIHIRVSQLRVMSLAGQERRKASLAELAALVEAMCNRDADTAERLSHDHVMAAAQSALSHAD
ncbi:GntR family transcriptional regulator [Pseudooceanicola sp. MF1-13]|uniref:GntR family transcriptional regulator n=1 Tax=Pseudooceanicola sp. MF1-13 TaxID=3379095 RepID=UPI003891E868